jgi:uncharacterized protein YndB with AHSA1/START domain
MTSTVKIHRVLRAEPEKVYRAFLDRDAIVKWLPPYGFVCTVDHMNPSVGGTFKMSFTNFSNGSSNSFGGEYKELVPFERIVYTDKFDEPGLEGDILVSITLTKVSCGTDIDITQSGIPSVIPVEMCYLGWQESMDQLAKLVEPSI